MTISERQPIAGWADCTYGDPERASASLYAPVWDVQAEVLWYINGGKVDLHWEWRVFGARQMRHDHWRTGAVDRVGHCGAVSGRAATKDAAKLAAEDALRELFGGALGWLGGKEP